MSWKNVGIVTFVGAAVLLLSFGGAIFAAPLTLPLMLMATRRHPTRAFRRSAAIIGSLTAAEVGWALTYVLVGEIGTWIWLVPLAAAALAVWIYGAPGASVRSPIRPPA